MHDLDTDILAGDGRNIHRASHSFLAWPSPDLIPFP